MYDVVLWSKTDSVKHLYSIAVCCYGVGGRLVEQAQRENGICLDTVAVSEPSDEQRDRAYKGLAS